MAQINNNVVDFKTKRLELENECKFLEVLDTEFSSAKEIPSTVFDRIANIKHQALLARQRNELMEM